MINMRHDIGMQSPGSDFERLKDLIIEVTGLSFLDGAGNDYSLQRALALRMRLTQTRSVGEYFLQVVESQDSDELRALVDELTIGETHFFRDPGIFDALTDTILPEIIDRNGQIRTARIWSAGCSTGPEPYSIAILIHRLFPSIVNDWKIQIIGTDINRRFLKMAQTARFGAWAMRNVPPAISNECFSQTDGAWQLLDPFRAAVQFHQHNLITDDIPNQRFGLAQLDLVICRNVAIYFSTATMRKLVQQFGQCLRPGGWLVLGHAELLPQTMDGLREFESITTPGGIIYRKRALPGAGSVVSVKPRFDALNRDRPAPVIPTKVVTDWPTLGDRQDADDAREFIPERAFEARPTRPDSNQHDPIRPAPGRPETIAAQSAEKPDLALLVDGGKWAEVRSLAENQIQNDPLDGEAHRFLGIALSHMGEYSAAMESFRNAIYLDRGDPLPHYLLATLLKDCSRFDDARREFQLVAKKLSKRQPDAPVSPGASMRNGDLLAVVAMWLGDQAAPTGEVN